MSHRLRAIIVLILLPSWVHWAHAQKSLKQYLDSYSSDQTVEEAFVPSGPLFIPFSEFEYSYEREHFDKILESKGRDIFKLNFKPLKEILLSVESRKKIRDLNRNIVRHQINEQKFDQLNRAFSDLFQMQLLKISENNKPFLKKYLQQKKDLAFADAKSLKQILDLQAQLDIMESTPLRTLKNTTFQDRTRFIDQLVRAVPVLTDSFEQVEKSGRLLSLKKSKMNLKKVDDEMKASSLLQGVTYFEIRQNRENFEKSYRMGLSFPLDAFGDSDNRRTVDRLADEVALRSSEKNLLFDLKLTQMELKSTAAELRILEQRKSKLLSLLGAKSRAASTKIQTTVSLLKFETELEILEKTKDFYLLYFEYLKQNNLLADFEFHFFSQPELWTQRLEGAAS